MASTDENLPPATTTHTSSRRLPRALVWSVVAILAVVAAGAVVFARQAAALGHQAELRQQWADELDDWQQVTLGIVPEPAARLGPHVSGAANETADGVATIRTECDRAASAAGALADPAPAPTAPADLPETAKGYAALADRVTASDAAVTAYVTDAGTAAASLATLCAFYPDLAQANLDQAAGVETLAALLGECELAEIGCLPKDRTTWSAIADAFGPAYTEPERQRGDLYGRTCPTPALADVCSTLSSNATALVPLYEAYTQAVRNASDAGIEQARASLTAQLETGAQALHDVAVPLLPEGSDDVPSALAQTVRQVALDADAAWLAADGDLMIALD